MEAQIDYWHARYDEELEKRDTEIYNMKLQKDNLIEDHETLKVTFIEHQEFIDYWLNVKEERRIAAELLALQTECALKIQVGY